MSGHNYNLFYLFTYLIALWFNKNSCQFYLGKFLIRLLVFRHYLHLGISASFTNKYCQFKKSNIIVFLPELSLDLVIKPEHGSMHQWDRDYDTVANIFSKNNMNPGEFWRLAVGPEWPEWSLSIKKKKTEAITMFFSELFNRRKFPLYLLRLSQISPLYFLYVHYVVYI